MQSTDLIHDVIDIDDDEPVPHHSQHQPQQQQQNHHHHPYSKHEKRRRMLERELKDLQAEFPSPNILSREERRVQAAEAAKARMEARTRDGEPTTVSTGKPRGRGRMPILYDGQGIHMKSGQDVCDCLEPECPGCHFPCKGCGSQKCGRKCRVHRKWIYTQVVEQLPYDESIVLRTKKV